MTKFYQIKKKIGNTEYVAQFNGLSAALKAADSSYIDGTNITSLEKSVSYLFENVIVVPAGLTPDDFDDMDTLNQVIEFATNVMNGKEKPATTKKAAATE